MSRLLPCVCVMTDQAQALRVLRLRLLGPSAGDGLVPALQLCSHLRWAQHDGGVAAQTVDQLHQALLIVHPAGTSGRRLFS